MKQRLLSNCKNCGDPFFHYPSRPNRRYCSKACSKLRYKHSGQKRKWRHDKDGYLVACMTHHPVALHCGKIQHHWYVMYEEHDNKDLVLWAKKNGGSIHHRNGIKDDNRFENLELWIKPQPGGIRLDDLIATLSP